MQPTKLLLIGESFSPWTKKARWALEYCGLHYKYQEYTPTLSEPWLRWQMRQWSGIVSVPVLFVDREVFRGSWEIARYANETAGDKRLGQFDAIKPWNALSEAALAQGRTNVVRRILQDNRALEESLPAFVPASLRSPLRFLARDAVSRLDKKYAHLAKPDAIHQALIQTRKTLAQNHSDYLLGTFSYADISMAIILEVIAPIAHHEPPLGPATQECWKDQSLANEFEDLIAWRNRLASNAANSYSQFSQT